MTVNTGSMGNKNQLNKKGIDKKPTNKKSNSVKETEIISRQEKERKLLEEIGNEKQGLSTRNKVAIGTAAGVLGATAVLIPTVKYFVDNEKHIITMKVQGTNYETYRLEVKKGSLVKTLKTYEITGYKFKGFYKDEACTIPYLETDKVTKAATVYCKYAPITYTVTYPTNQEGYVVNAEQTIEYGNKFIFTVTLLDRYDKSDVVVKVNGKVIEPANEYNQYIVSFVESDLNITVENVKENVYTVLLNLYDTLELEVVEGATLRDILEENETVIKEQVISYVMQNQNFYTKEQLQNLTLEDLLKATTAGFYIEGDNNMLDMDEIINETGGVSNIHAAFATLDKLKFESNSVEAIDAEISGEIVIPRVWIDDGAVFEITTITAGAFANCDLLENVVIPNSVTSIGESAFERCISLAKVVLPYGLTSIEAFTFCDCEVLRDVYIPNTVTYIGDYAFCACYGLDEIIIPDAVTALGEGAFKWAELRELKIGKGLQTLEDDEVFLGCPLRLEKITVDDDNPYFTDKGDCLIEINTKKLILGCNTSVIPADGSVVKIGSNAFYYSGINSVTIPNSVTQIEECAFTSCENLTEIIIPSSVEKLGSHVFWYCTSLKTVKIEYGLSEIGEYAFLNCPSLIEITIPDSVTSIREHAFQMCLALTEITIPNSVTSIRNYVFRNCSALTEITIPNSVTSIGGYAFYGCSALKEIVLPNNITRINENTFYKCTSLTRITIPNSVTNIYDYAFYECSSIVELIIPSSVIYIGKYAFNKCSNIKSVKFEVIDGWYKTTKYDAVGTLIKPDTIGNETGISYYLTHYYSNYYWKRNQ